MNSQLCLLLSQRLSPNSLHILSWPERLPVNTMTVRTRLKGMHMNSLCVRPRGLILAHLSIQPRLLGSWLICLCSVFQCLQGLSLCHGFLICLLCCGGILPCSGGLLLRWLWPGGPLLRHGFLHCLLWYGSLPCRFRHGPKLHYSTVCLCFMAQVLQWSTVCYYSMAQVLNCATVCHCSMVQVFYHSSVYHTDLALRTSSCSASAPPPSWTYVCSALGASGSLSLRGAMSRCAAGVPTSSSRGHSIQNLYHCLTNSISQYTTCLGTDFIHSWFQSGGLFKTHTHHITKSCFTASGHYWAFPYVSLPLTCFRPWTVSLFIVIVCCLAWPPLVLDYSSALPWILLFAGVGPCLFELRTV